eukprot:scaffold14367_cov250-Ochromonas_danica.AAC.20
MPTKATGIKEFVDNCSTVQQSFASILTSSMFWRIESHLRPGGVAVHSEAVGGRWCTLSISHPTQPNNHHQFLMSKELSSLAVNRSARRYLTSSTQLIFF